MQNLTRRTFATFSVTAAATALGLVLTITCLAATAAKSESGTRAPQDDKLQSEFLLDLTLEAQTPHNLGSAGGGRLIVPVSGGSFAGPRLKGAIVPPGGDWVVQRADGSRLLDVRILLQTDDGQKIYMSWRGIAYGASGWSAQRAHCADVRDGGTEVCVVEQRRHSRCLPPRFRQDRLPRLPHSLASEMNDS